MDRWLDVCSIDDIPLLGSRRVARGKGLPVALFRPAPDQVFALLDRCPHKGGPLSQGIVMHDAVACPLHNWTIQFASGEARAPDVGCTARFAVKLEGERVLLDREQLETLAIDLPAPLAGPCLRQAA